VGLVINQLVHYLEDLKQLLLQIQLEILM